MKAQENIVSENTNLQADALTDLPIADKQPEVIKGGASPYLFVHAAEGKHLESR